LRVIMNPIRPFDKLRMAGKLTVAGGFRVTDKHSMTTHSV